jgi:hypothetical protein
MAAIEPNWIALLWFAAFATVCTVAFLVVAGMLPLGPRADSASSIWLVAGNGALLAALLIGTALYGYTELRWSSSIVVAGLAVLFAPGLFQLWPSSSRDGTSGLIALVGLQILALAALATLAGPSLMS